MLKFKKVVKKEPSQCDLILKYMRKHKKGITGKDAYKIAYSMNLAQRIYDLRQRGHKIVDEWVEVKGVNGKKYRVKSYKLVER